MNLVIVLVLITTIGSILAAVDAVRNRENTYAYCFMAISISLFLVFVALTDLADEIGESLLLSCVSLHV